jgi:hypothetical protein
VTWYFSKQEGDLLANSVLWAYKSGGQRATEWWELQLIWHDKKRLITPVSII